jgi:hypothetical protein
MKYFILILLLGTNLVCLSQSDFCASAPLLTVNPSSCVNTAYSFSNAFGDEIADPSCGASARDAWYSFVATSAYTTVNATSNNASGGDIVLSVYSACNAASQIGCANGSGGAGLFGGSANEALTVPTTIGNTYYVRISRVGNCCFGCPILGCSSTTSGNICLIESAAPANNQNCSSAAVLCSNAALSSASPGFGTQELSSNPPQGCLVAGEHQSSWYVFSPQSTGTIQFNITPLTPIDYDFAIWGPFTTLNCASLGSPIRCSYAAPGSGINPTGLNGTALDASEGAGGDGFVQQLTIGAAQVGQIYVMVVDNWTNNGVPFTMQWNLGGGLSLDCTIPLPIELSNFYGSTIDKSNHLYWISDSEINNQFYSLHRSVDGISWELIHTETGVTHSNSQLTYHFIDRYFTKNNFNYYRLSQTDVDGNTVELKTISIDNRFENKQVLRKFNLLGQEVDSNYKGIVIVEYVDGSFLKILQ